MDHLTNLGLEDKAQEHPGRLSGEQQQRVAIARALAMRPKLLLFDEPTSSLDPELIGEVLVAMRDLAYEKRTKVIVTHEMNFAAHVADRIVFMEDGQIVVDASAPEVLESSEHPRLQAYFSHLSQP